MNYRRRTEIEAKFWDGSREEGVDLIKWIHSCHGVDGLTLRAGFREPKVFNWTSSYDKEVKVTWEIAMTAHGDGAVRETVIHGNHWVVREPGKGLRVYSQEQFNYQFEKVQE